MSNFLNLLIALVIAAVTYGTPLLFGTLGEVLTEKSGNLNLGVEGIMFMGGALGLGGVFYYEKAAGSGANGFLAVGIGITDRRYVSREDDTGYFHYAIDVAKSYEMEG